MPKRFSLLAHATFLKSAGVALTGGTPATHSLGNPPRSMVSQFWGEMTQDFGGLPPEWGVGGTNAGLKDFTKRFYILSPIRQSIVAYCPIRVISVGCFVRNTGCTGYVGILGLIGLRSPSKPGIAIVADLSIGAIA
jgi:hypothetical protein